MSVFSHGRVEARTLLVDLGACLSIMPTSVFLSACHASLTVREVLTSSREGECNFSGKLSGV